MKITNVRFGEIEFDDNMIINFEDGIIGFESYKRYVLINLDDGIFLWLTSIDEPDLIFPIFAARLLMEEFPQEENYEAFGIVRLNQDPRKIIINLKAPIYINQDKKIGHHKILDEDKYPIDYILFKEN